jgi:GH25 family lysozyme M1 (1,4-beta-N-acetylmuramidase)
MTRRLVPSVILAIALALPATTAEASAVTRPAGHFNVANSHSPQLERLLDGGSTAAPAIARGPLAAKPVLGIDVASGEHAGGATIDWADVAAAGYRFAFIKATEGSYYANPDFAADAAGAKAAGLLVAAYHFANPRDSSGTLQADFALDYAGAAGAGADGQTLPFIVDLEYDPYSSNECYGLTQVQMVNWIRAFSSEIDRRTGQHPVFYTIADWWDKCTGDSTLFTADPLWIASYPKTAAPTLPAAWSTWAYWQYTSDGKVPGITGDTDISELNPAALEVAQPPTPSDPEGGAVNLAVRSVNALAGQVLSYSATGLPAGLSIDPATGLISGTLPDTPGVSEVSVTVSGTGLTSVTDSFGWIVHGPVSVTRPANQAGQAGTPVVLTVQASDGLPGCTLSFSATGLPPGLSVSPCGVISGWLAKPGTYHPVVTVTDSSSGPGQPVSFTWLVSPPARTGPAGHLVVASDRGCLTEASAKTKKGVPPVFTIGVTVGCSHIPSERWTVADDGALIDGGRCLAPDGSAGALTLRACRDSSFQDWQLGSAGALVNLGTGSCLTAIPVKHGVTAELADCPGGPPQDWALPAGPLASAFPGWCASTWHSPAFPAGPVNLRKCGTSRATTWSAGPAGTLQSGGQCLSLTYPAVAGSAVTTARCRGTAGQVWEPLNTAQAAEQYLNPGTGLCLTDSSDQPGPGQLVLGYCTTTDPGTAWQLR